jgi:hypothetical protein
MAIRCRFSASDGGIASGPPFTIQTGFDQTGFLQNLAGRPNLLPGRSPNAFEGPGYAVVRPDGILAERVGTFGNLGRNTGIVRTL